MASTATGTIAVGYGRTADNALRAFRWTTTSGTMQDLGLLPGGNSARAWAVSADGTTVVGCAADFKTDIHALLWTPTLGMVDLNTYMPALGVDRTGWMLESAWAISAVVAGRHATESARLSLRKTYQSGGFVPVWTGFVTFCLAGLGRPAQAGIVREIPVRGLHRRSIAMSLRNPCQAWLAVGVALACLLAGPARAVTIDMVPVGNPGNANDPATGSLYGAVNYEYQIGKYEVTLQQYTDFLNAVADTDTYSLYNTSMGSFQNSAGITRSGASGSYTYAVSGPFGTTPAGANSPGNRPVTFVNWFDAARFANWMANGQPTGLQTGTTTENGAYTLSGVTSGTAPARNAINPNTSVATTFWIPTENEWYKAAYYDPTLNSGAGGYYTYATRSNSAPGNTIGSGTNQANYYAGDYAVTQSPSNLSNQNYLTNAGAFTNSASSYGTFDQSGNVWEWNDLTGTAGVNRGLRGGSFNNNAAESSSSQRSAQLATSEGSSGNWGFRVATVPEPSTCAMALAGLACGGFLVRLRQRTWTLRRSADPDSSGRRPSFGQSRHSIRSSDLTATTYRQGACS